MGSPKDIYTPLSNKGLVLRQDPSLLEPGQYAQLTNMDSPIEGVLTTRQGTLQCAHIIQSTVQFLHTISRLVIPNATTAHYLGVGVFIYRSNSAVGAGMTFTAFAVFPIFGPRSPVTSSNILNQRFIDADFGSAGQNLVYKFIPSPQIANFKDNGSGTLQTWGVFPPFYPAVAFPTGTGTGPPAFTGAEVPYTYVYTYLNSTSAAESNPSIYQPEANGVTPDGTEIEVVMYNSMDPQIDTINLYRAGGSLADGLYRFVLSTPNTSLLRSIVYDTLLDQDILDNQLLSTDNDPPVPSGLPVPWVGNTNTTGLAGSVIVAKCTVALGPTGYTPYPGDLLYVAEGLSTYELAYCIVGRTDFTGTYITYLSQLGQPSAPYSIRVTTHTGAPCSMALAAFNSIFLAGDAYNPNYLYQSKPNQPESFPVIQQSTGIIQSIAVGTPSNPINGISEYSGAIICLNAQTIFSVSVFNNQMQQPVPSPARHGLITKGAWVKVTNAIWYLSYDGIYVFTGGQETWMSEPVDPLFKGLSMNGYLPINMTPGQGVNNPPTGLDIMTMTTVDNKVFLLYTDTAGNYNRLVYDIPFSRWHVESFYAGVGNAITAQYGEPDTGNSWLGLSLPTTPYNTPQLDLTKQGTSDGWTTSPTAGTQINYGFSPTVIDQQAKTDKLFSDFQVEAEGTLCTTTINTQYDWSGGNDGIDVFTIPSSTRQRYPFVLQQTANGPEGKLAYAMQLLFSGITTGQANFYTLGLHYDELTDFRKGLSADYSDIGYPDDKTFRSITVEIDTGGVAATAYLDVDGQLAVATFTINTTYYARKVILSVPSFITGKMARIRFTPGVGGKTNLYGQIAWDVEKLPAALTHFDSNTFGFDWDGFNFVKQAWFCVDCTSTITFNLYVDGDVLFWTEVIPAFPVRGVYRFYLPSVNLAVLNKSKVKRFTLDAATPFRVYGMQSRMEWLPCGSDQRSDYEQFALTEMMQPH